MRVKALARFGALINMLALGAAALGMVSIASPSFGDDVQVAYIEPAQLSPELAAQRLRPSFAGPQLTNNLLASYVQRQQQLKSFNAFDVRPTELTEQVLLGYIDRTRGTNLALDAIDSFADQPALTGDVLETYAQKKFVPTVRKVQVSSSERLCLTQAIYHEARGESESGQWAVANVIINRAMSHKYPTTLCGVVFQNADNGYHHCQFTFACDGKSDFGNEHGAWNRAVKMASIAYNEFQRGDRPGVIPSTALYYHTTAVNPSWSDRYRQVAHIGSHLFYSPN